MRALKSKIYEDWHVELIDRSFTVEHAGKSHTVVDDAVLSEWASGHGLPAWQAPVEALRNRIIPLRYLKNLWALDIDEQIRLCQSRVFICGCGGLGGVLIDLLARAGVGRLRLMDYDVFSPSNLNRQWLSDMHHLDVSKAQTAKAHVQSVNPLVDVEAFQELLEADNAVERVRGMDLVLDALDNLETRFRLSEAAKSLKVPFIHAAVAGWWGQISTILPESRVDLTSIYGSRRSRDPAEELTGVLGMTAASVASLQAFEAIRLLCGRKPVYADRLFYFDGESGHMEILPLELKDA